jgi:uncharacterized protein YuzB (UPF0349 family)
MYCSSSALVQYVLLQQCFSAVRVAAAVLKCITSCCSSSTFVLLRGMIVQGQQQKVLLRGMIVQGQQQKVLLRGMIVQGQQQKVPLRGIIAQGQQQKYFTQYITLVTLTAVAK